MTVPNQNTDGCRSSRENEVGQRAQSPVEVFHTEYDNRKPCEVIIAAVSAVKGLELEELGCQYGSIDPDAPDALFGKPVAIGDGGTVGVEFGYSGYRVSVRSNGCITLLDGSSQGMITGGPITSCLDLLVDLYV